MTARKAEVPITDLIKVWCERCCIRIAPNEEQTVARGKTYHPHCYSKLLPAISKPKGKVSQAVPGSLV